MTIYFAWAEPDEGFSSHQHCRHDLDIFNLQIHEKEDEFAKAWLTINPEQLHERKAKAFISWTDENDTTHLLFQGYLYEIPKTIRKRQIQIELIARPTNAHELVTSLPTKPHPLFVTNTSQPQADFQLASAYCDRKTLEICHSPWFEDVIDFTIDGTQFDDSVKIVHGSPPLAGVKVNLTLQWTQQMRGLANVGDEIAGQFQEGCIASYTQLKLKNGSLEPGSRLGRSGFWVVRSSLKRLQTLENEDGPATPLNHYEWDFWVGWTYQQKRVEEIQLVVPHNIQGLPSEQGDMKEIHIKLNNPAPPTDAHPWLPGVIYLPGAKAIDGSELFVCQQEHLSQTTRAADESCWEKDRDIPAHPAFATASFVQSPAGTDILQEALQLARWTLARSARAIRIDLQLPWNDYHHINTNQTLRLQDPRLPGGSAVGKVIRVDLHCHGDQGERWVELTLACAVGINEDYSPALPELETIATPPATEGVIEPPQQILQHIQVVNGPETQRERLLSITTNDAERAKTILQRRPTRVEMRFADLRSRDALRSTYSYQATQGWSAPRQINLQPGRDYADS